MKRTCMISVLIFTLGLVFVPVVRAEQEKTEEAREETIETAKQASSKDVEITRLERKGAKIEKSSEAEKKTKRLPSIIKKEIESAKKKVTSEDEVMEEITGLVIERTMTKIGYEFYEKFFIHWEAPKGIKDYNIFISERASPLWGSWIKIEINTNTVWEGVLRPRSEDIEEAVKNAVGATTEYLYRYEEYEFQSEDMMGSGI